MWAEIDESRDYFWQANEFPLFFSLLTQYFKDFKNVLQR